MACALSACLLLPLHSGLRPRRGGDRTTGIVPLWAVVEFTGGCGERVLEGRVRQGRPPAALGRPPW